MDSAPSAKWQELFMNYVKRNPIPWTLAIYHNNHL